MEISLSDKLKKLKIDLSGIEESSISAWNNKHMPDTVAFFDWFTKYLNESNVLEPSESEEYKFLDAKGTLLHDDEYELAMADIERTHPGIFDVELNKSQIVIIESEYENLKDYERKLEEETKANMDISKQIEKEIRIARNKMDVLSVKYEDSYDICVGEARKVDIGFKDLRLKVLGCLESWNQDWSIYSTGNEQINRSYKDGLSNVTRFCDNLCLNSITLELEQSNDAELATLKKRLYDAILYSYVGKVKEKQLESELAFYKDFECFDRSLINNDDEWSLIQKESLEISRRINTDKSLEALKELISEYVTNLLDKLDIIKLEKTVLAARDKHEKVREMDNIVTNIVVYNVAHLNLFKIIDENIQAMDLFLRKDLLSLVNNDIRSCMNRTDLMRKRIQEQIDEQQKPIEQQNALIGIIVDLISNEHIDEITPEVFKNLVTKFYGTISDYEMKLFFNDVEIYRSKVNVLEKNNYFMKEHLKSQSSNEIVMCPLEYSSALCKLREATKEADNIVAKIRKDRESTDETLKDNKWLRISRQLWMYFLVNPRKVIEYLKEITEEHNKNISKQLHDDNKIIQNAHKYINDD